VSTAIEKVQAKPRRAGHQRQGAALERRRQDPAAAGRSRAPYGSRAMMRLMANAIRTTPKA